VEVVVQILEEMERPEVLEHYARQAAHLTWEVAGEKGRAGGVGIVLAGSEYVQHLNLRYRGEDWDTDVLAFPMEEPDDEDSETDEPILGDVIISLPTAASQAQEYGHDLTMEVALLVAHGILHLLGYDDHTPAGEERMWEKQREVLARLSAPSA